MIKLFSLWVVIFSVGPAWSTELKVATINLSLSRPFQASVRVTEDGTPFVAERKLRMAEEIAKVLNQNDIDILAIQELWNQEAINALEMAHPDYAVYSKDADAWLPGRSATGLFFLVKKSIEVLNVRFTPFSAENMFCSYSRSFCDRGFLQLIISYEGYKTVILNSHFSSHLSQSELRLRQTNELIKQIESGIFALLGAVVIVAGHLGYSSNYGPLTPGDIGTEEDWLRNTEPYQLLLSTSRVSSYCEDSYITNAADPEYVYTQNKNENNLTRLSNFTGSEPDQRSDYILICGEHSFWEIKSNSLIFNDPIYLKNHGINIHLSDHFGVLTTISLP